MPLLEDFELNFLILIMTGKDSPLTFRCWADVISSLTVFNSDLKCKAVLESPFLNLCPED